MCPWRWKDVPEVEGMMWREFDLVFREGFDLGWGILGFENSGLKHKVPRPRSG